MTETVESFSAKETFLLGERLGKQAYPGEILCLDGDLGTGKTVFTKGFASGLGIREDVVSPTFTIIREYDGGRLKLYHFDVYRIGDIDEMDELGYEEYFFGDGVTLIEWSELIGDLVPEEAHHVLFEKDPAKGDDYRRITLDFRS